MASPLPTTHTRAFFSAKTISDGIAPLFLIACLRRFTSGDLPPCQAVSWAMLRFSLTASQFPLCRRQSWSHCLLIIRLLWCDQVAQLCSVFTETIIASSEHTHTTRDVKHSKRFLVLCSSHSSISLILFSLFNPLKCRGLRRLVMFSGAF